MTPIHPSAWTLTEADGADGAEQHVIPNDDLRPHTEARDCWCKPFQDVEGGAPDNLWAHNSMDRREYFENGKALA